MSMHDSEKLRAEQANQQTRIEELESMLGNMAKENAELKRRIELIETLKQQSNHSLNLAVSKNDVDAKSGVDSQWSQA